jgi:hypothetical protein
MSRKKKNRNREEKNWRRQLEKKRQDDVVKHSAATLSCAAETAGDFAYQCTHQQEELNFDLPYLHLALEIWRESPLAPPLLLAALDELLTEQLRHRDTLIRFAQQLERLAADPSLHIHLDPIEHYLELVQNRLFAEPPAD